MDDFELVKNCIKGRPEAQRLLYDRYSSIMLSVCYRYTKSMADAEDVLQEGFIKIFLNIHQYRFTGEFGAWIRRIMVTTAINYLKRNERYQTDLLFPDDPLHIVNNQYNPEIYLNAKDLAELIRQLPPGYQAIFNLYAVEGFNHAEIGKILGIKEPTSRSQYARARALLINWVEKNNDIKRTSYAK